VKKNQKNQNYQKKHLTENASYENMSIMLIFDLDFKRKAFGLKSPLSWFFEEGNGKWNINRKGVLFLFLFFVTFCSFGFWYFYMTPCVSTPAADVTILGQVLGLDGGNQSGSYVYIDTSDPHHEVKRYLQLKGVFDPTKQFSAHLGFSHNYPNYMRSIPYKFL